jgi:hypothetical protein
MAALGLLFIGAWIYQSNALFYLVLVVGGVFTDRRKSLYALSRWLSWHAAVLSLALVLAYLLIKAAYAHGIWTASDRIAFDPDPLGKIWWYFQEPFENAAALFALDDNASRADPPHILAALAVSACIFFSGFLEWRRRGGRAAAIWWTAFLFFPPAAYGISIIAAERWSTYRTIYPLVGVMLVFFLLSLRALADRFPWRGARTVSIGLAALFFVAFAGARKHAYALIAWPQQLELTLVEEGAKKIDVTRPQRVFFVIPSTADTPAPYVYADEFGSLSTDSDWTPKEMLKQVMHVQHPEVRDWPKRCRMACGRVLPPKGLYDVVINLRRIHAP